MKFCQNSANTLIEIMTNVNNLKLKKMELNLKKHGQMSLK